MCGRYTLSATALDLAAQFRLIDFVKELQPRYNIAPSQLAPIIRHSEAGPYMALAKWGLVPFWADDPSIGNRLINARAETLSERPAFRQAFRRRRCLVPADGFYEWRREGKAKQPYLILRQNRRPFAFAGLWERWARQDEREVLDTFIIVTVDAKGLAAQVHDRMPLILSPTDYDSWLDPASDTRTLSTALAGDLPRDFTMYPVGRAVNNARNDDESLVKAIRL